MSDMGLRPSLDHSLDRYPNRNGNYEPGNVRWATQLEQQRNRRDNQHVEFRGQLRTWSEIAELADAVVGPRTVKSRLRRGWHPEVAVSLPPTVSHKGNGGATRGRKLINGKFVSAESSRAQE